ncbi:MAG TPA: hypothetical protein VFG69_12825 [Nannocystaceae bacterium]|nr:hypothetical protein [Nannocystaceae bacterium]
MIAMRPIACVVAALAIAAPARLAVAAPAHTDSDAAQPGWDDEPIPPAPDSAPVPPPVVTQPLPTPAPAPVVPSEAQRRTGNALWIAAGVTAGVGLVLNASRAYIVSGPCQTGNGTGGCETSWALVTPFNYAFNIASIGLAGAGGGLRGRYDATLDPDGHQGRRPVLISVGASLLALGLATSITMRSLWLGDWANPQGPEVFDFARTGHAFGYYGGLQLSSMAMAAGVAMLVYGAARPRRAATAKRRKHLLVMPSGAGLALTGRF